tara:strand:+ start:170 stop:481 length:312 start_codon:yes stop_codon:yes gene_type:complete
MKKITFIFLIILIISCDSKDENLIEQTGTVMHTTSCGGGSEPVYIIGLDDNKVIMTATLSKEFQVPNLKINFKTKKNTASLYCTQDKVYPMAYDVFDVRKSSK